MSSRRLALLEFDMGWSMWLTEAYLPFYIGRHFDNDLQNSSSCVSRRHCSFDIFDDQLYIVDSGSLNGTILHDRVIKNEKTLLTEKTCLLLSDMMIWVTPCDGRGELIGKKDNIETLAIDSVTEKKHGVCLVDICNSMDMELEYVNTISQMLRAIIMEHDHDKLYLLKYMGDGYLAVFNSCPSIFSATKRLLAWQTSNGNIFSANIRVTLDVGITHQIHGHDRSGLPICRVARIDKTQARDIDVPSADIKEMKSRNRCLMTKNASLALASIGKEEDYTFLGERKLKGFGEELHAIYQYNI